MSRTEEATIRNIRTDLVDEITPIVGGTDAWTTRWRACWAPVQNSARYLITIVTSEGISPKRMEVTDPCYEVDVAHGTVGPRGRLVGRNQMVGLMKVMLSISVRADLEDGTVGPPSWDIAIGEKYQIP